MMSEKEKSRGLGMESTGTLILQVKAEEVVSMKKAEEEYQRGI